ncbi:recombinase family protein [Vallitalea sp.]|jgi:DNA invertase Pin-like site-specific DNA recombinase|uniref:recombinase family protein n=1 Tax=Vallitalea sp. TaxID=1882829 RepID=UPI0026011FBC|nr:recombinase family protein [Vallitalea sp.]MCT4686575.1 recombinase family protein [Vallitalea sp.]
MNQITNSKTFFYGRVSTKEQDPDRQITAVKKYCVDNDISLDERDIYIDRQSGKDFQREGYITLKRQLREGYLLLIKELDRLGRNYSQIQEEWRELTRERKVNIIVLETDLLNTVNKSELECTLIADISLSILSYVAQKERNKMLIRQREGIAKAKLQGKYTGRRPIDVDMELFAELYTKWRVNKELKAVDCMRLLGIKPGVFYKHVRAWEKKNNIQLESK